MNKKCIKSQKRGPADKRLDNLELGYAYALSYLKKNNEYVNLQIVFEYDRITVDDICELNGQNDRWMRLRKKYIAIKSENQKHRPGKKVNYKIYQDGKEYSANESDPLYRNIQRECQRCREKVRAYIEKGGHILKIDDSFEKSKVIKMILDCYPEPNFFTDGESSSVDWNPELMKKIFSDGESDNFFWVRTPGDGIIPISTLSYEIEDYRQAIDEYIQDSSWHVTKEKIKDKITHYTKVYKMDISHEAKRFAGEKKPKGMCSWGQYTITIEGRSEKNIRHSNKQPIILNLKAPKYDMMEAGYVESELYDYENAIYFTIYPLLMFDEFHYQLISRKSYQKNNEFYLEKTSDFWYQVYNRIQNRKWLGRNIGINDSDLVLFHEFGEFLYQDSDSYFFVLEPTVRNAYIIKKLTK